MCSDVRTQVDEHTTGSLAIPFVAFGAPRSFVSSRVDLQLGNVMAELKDRDSADLLIWGRVVNVSPPSLTQSTSL